MLKNFKVVKKLLLLSFLLVSCTTTKYITVPMSSPPAFYEPATNITTQKDLLLEYREALIKISEWQIWYDIQIGSNYFRGKNEKN